jgi:peptidoglycan/LPS O-acetylase OafA/YrhL
MDADRMIISPKPVSNRLTSIDILRGIAILAVLIVHVPHDAPGGWREHPFFFLGYLADFGYMGVPLFIVISGFCIHRAAAAAYAATGSYRFNWAQFWKRRFFRLYPPYVVAIGVSLLAAFFFHNRFPDPASFLGWDLVTHLLLMHNLTQEFATSLGNGAFWSLGTEEQLYALYFLLLLLLTRQSTARALMVVGLVTVAWRLLIPFFPDTGWNVGVFHLGKWYQWPLHYWLHWALGAVAVNAYVGNTKLLRWCYSVHWAMVLLVVATVLNMNTFRFLLWTQLPLEALRQSETAWLGCLHNMGELAALLGFFCLLNWGLRLEADGHLRGWLARALAKVGTFSYSIYLVHIPIIYVAQERMPLGYAPAQWVLRYLLYGSLAIVGGYLFHMGVERWFLHGRVPRFRGNSAPIAESAQ